MQFYAPLICSMLLIISLALPVTAKTTQRAKTTQSPKTTKTIDQRINELSNRVNAFESNWSRFRIGGDLTVKSNTFFDESQQNWEELNFNQELNLNLDAFLDRNLSVSTRLTHFGRWGDKYTGAMDSFQMNTPLQLEEAFLRMEYPTNLNYLGRFRFSISPLGLISDFYSSPVEGFSFQKVYKQYHAIALYSRVNNKFTFQTDDQKTYEVSSGNYWAFRFGWANPSHIIGINLLPNGITGEKGFSLDWSHEWSGQKIALETAWHFFTPPDYSVAEKVEWAPGILVSYGKVLNENSYAQIKSGYFGNGFRPSYSSLAHASGDDREWFVPNSYGVELYFRHQLRPGWALENRLLALKPVHYYPTSSDIYHLAAYFTKSFSPVNQLQLGVEYKKLDLTTSSNQIFLAWNLRF